MSSDQFKLAPRPEPRRVVALALAAGLVVAAAIVGPRSAAAPSRSEALLVSSVPARALSASWTCSGGTTGGSSVLPSALVFDNAGPRPVAAVAHLVASDGHHLDEPVTVPAGGTARLDETVPGASTGSWVAALVTVFGPDTSVSEDVSSHWGRTSQPCASSTSSRWYFPEGFDLRNAWEFLTVVNPYPTNEIVDLSFTTNFGLEVPGDYQGVVVPPRGMTVLGLEDHLRRRAHIAATVTARAGGVVAFETELVTTPPKSAPVVGTPGAANPVAPVAGLTLMLGAPAPTTDMWWPAGGQEPGVQENFYIYDPGAHAARAVLRLYSSSGAGSGAPTVASHTVDIGADGWLQLTSNGQPWSLPSTPYAVQLRVLSGGALVGERAVTATAPALERGRGVALGEPVASRAWELPVVPVQAVGARPPTVTAQLYNPGTALAVAQVERAQDGALSPVGGLDDLAVAPGQRVSAVVPVADQSAALLVQSTRPLVVSQDTIATRPARGVDSSPALPVTG